MTHYFLYWLSTGWWYLGLARAPLLCMSKTCPLSMRWPWSRSSSAHSATHPWFLMVWAIFWFPILYGLLPLGAELCLIVEFFSFILLFYFFLQFCYHFLPYHSIIPAVMLFDPSLLGLFRLAAYSSLNDLVWSLGFLLHCLRAPVSHLFPLGHPWPICFPWASSAIFLILHSYRFLLTPLGFPDPITLSFILGAHGLSISLLLSLLALLQACCGPFSLSYITYCLWVCYFSLFGLLWPVCFLKAHLFILWAHDPLFLPLGLNGFSIHLLTLFYPCWWTSSFYWASQNEHQQQLIDL